MDEMNEGLPIFSYKISHGDVIYSMVTLVNGTVQHI